MVLLDIVSVTLPLFMSILVGGERDALTPQLVREVPAIVGAPTVPCGDGLGTVELLVLHDALVTADKRTSEG